MIGCDSEFRHTLKMGDIYCLYQCHTIQMSALYPCSSLIFESSFLISLLQLQTRLILGGCKYDHITPLLRELHLLPVEHRITFNNF